MADAAQPTPAPARPAGGNVTRLEHDGREIFLLGTAHVSKSSVEEVRRVIDELRPDTVCVELDAGRYESLVDAERWRRFDVVDVLTKDRAGLWLASLVFAGFQKRLGDRLGVRPGAEMVAAVEEARRVGAAVVLADRDIQVTLLRCYERLGTWDRAQIAAVLAVLPFSAADIDEKQVEQLKDREAIGDVMTTFAREMPALEQPLIDERDRYLIAEVRASVGRRVVAVVGAAHVPGMLRHLTTPVDLEALRRTPPPRRVRPLAWTTLLLVAVVLLLPWLGVGSAAAAALTPRMIVAWALPTSLVTAVFAFTAGASLVTTLAAAVVAPPALLLPTFRFGAALGRLEAKLRPPAEADRARIRDDLLAPARARRNSALRPLLVAFATPLGRAVGVSVGLVWALVMIWI